MPNEEIDYLLGRFVREAGGRLTHLREDANGEIAYNGKKYIETNDAEDMQAIIIDDIPDEYDAFIQLANKFRIILIKK